MDPFPREHLKLLVTMNMPFGKYAGRKLVDLPEPIVYANGAKACSAKS